MTLSINGLSVNTFGDDKNQSIIFIHGFPYDHTMWEYQIEVLKDNYFCIVYDVRGLGESAVGDGQYTMEAYVNDLLMIVKYLELNRPILCGLSMGGYITLRAVEKAHDLFSGLILCDTKSDADDDQSKLKRASVISQIDSGGFIKFIESFVTNCFAEEAPVEDAEMFQATLAKAQRQNPVGVKGAIIAIISRTDTTSFLPKIKIPTLVLCGSFDKLTPVTVMRPLAEQIPEAEFAVIPQSGHMTPLENPESVNELIIGFLKRRF